MSLLVHVGLNSQQCDEQFFGVLQAFFPLLRILRDGFLGILAEDNLCVHRLRADVVSSLFCLTLVMLLLGICQGEPLTSVPCAPPSPLPWQLVTDGEVSFSNSLSFSSRRCFPPVSGAVS